MASTELAPSGRPLSFRVEPVNARARKLYRVARTAREQGDAQTARLAEEALRRVLGPAPQLPRLA